MPAPGDQHKQATAGQNPFEEPQSNVNEYSAQQIATLQNRLEKQLGPEYISSRSGPGGQKVHYLAAEKCIQLANEVFGFNGWSSSIRDTTVDFVDESASTGKISIGLSVIVRITLKDGAYHEDVGYGQIENCKSKAAAFEKAKKEGTTDALKRALRNFGNVLGNCIYDKTYLTKVTKLKIQPSKWDPDNLHRHSDYAPIKKEPMPESEASKQLLDDSCSTVKSDDDEFGDEDFNEANLGIMSEGHPDEVVLGPRSSTASVSSKEVNQPPPSNFPSRPPMNGQNPQTSRSMAPQGQQGQAPQQPMAAPQTPGAARPTYVPQNRGPPAQNQRFQPQRNVSMGQPQIPPPNAQPYQRLPHQPLPPFQPEQSHTNPIPQVSTPPRNLANPPSNHPRPPEISAPIAHVSKSEDAPQVGFFTARAAETLQQNVTALPPNVRAFNPHAESPSIRKTPGIDHTKTAPVNKDFVPLPVQSGASAQTTEQGSAAFRPHPPPRMTSNFVNPQGDQNRRIGMPGAPSPLQNRHSYKPPQMLKRPAEGNGGFSSRPPLSDVTNASVNGPLEQGGDIKRQKVENGHGIANAQNSTLQNNTAS